MSKGVDRHVGLTARSKECEKFWAGRKKLSNAVTERVEMSADLKKS